MIVLLLILFGCASGSQTETNKLMDKALGMASREAEMSLPVKDVVWKYSTKLFNLIPVSWSFLATDIEFWDATTMARISDVVETKPADQVRLEVQLSLATMVMNYGHFELKLPLLGTLVGSGRFQLAVNSFGVSAYYGNSCNKTRVYVWPPRGDPRLEIDSDHYVSRVIEFLFEFFGGGLFEDIIDYDITGGPLDEALRQPLTNAISKCFCEKSV